MTRHDEVALVRAWAKWQAAEAGRDEAYLEFFDTKVHNNPRFGGLNVFEVLDVLLNATSPNRHESA